MIPFNFATPLVRARRRAKKATAWCLLAVGLLASSNLVMPQPAASSNLVSWPNADPSVLSPAAAAGPTDTLELVGQIRSATVAWIEGIQVIDAQPTEIALATRSEGAGCGGGTPIATWKMKLETDKIVTAEQKQSLAQPDAEIQSIRRSLFEDANGTIFTGSGWCGYKPPYYSTNAGETWQVANSDGGPPNSTFSYTQFNGDVYVGTGYDPYPGGVYRWLGNGQWTHVLEIPSPRTIVDSMIVHENQLFVSSHLYGDGPCENTVPVYVSSNGTSFLPTSGIPGCQSVTDLLVAKGQLLAWTFNPFDPSQRQVYRWTGSGWILLGPLPLAIDDFATYPRPVATAEGLIYHASRMPSDTTRSLYKTLDFGLTWERIETPAVADITALHLHGATLYVGTARNPSSDTADVYMQKAPSAKIALVDFDGGSNSQDIDVIRDRRTPDTFQLITDFTEACPTSADHVEWKDCSPKIPDGSSEKNWPVAYVRGSNVFLKQARFKVEPGATLTNVKVVGTSTSPSLVFEKSGVSQTGNEIVVDNISSQGVLPDQVMFINLQISWKLEVAGHSIDAGSSSHPIYVLRGAPISPLYLTLVDFTTRDAAGKVAEGEVADAIWAEFTDRRLERRELDPVSGQVKGSGRFLQYWTPWSLQSKFEGHFACPESFSTVAMLEVEIGRCDAWAYFLVDALSIHGITASAVGVGDIPGFPTGPSGAEVMLIKTWTFGTSHGGGDFPYEIKMKRRPDGSVEFIKKEFDEAPGLPGQSNPNPPGFFKVGDHAVVTYKGRIYDPSYGTGPFSSIRDWANASLDGYARLKKDKPDMFTLEGHRGIP